MATSAEFLGRLIKYHKPSIDAMLSVMSNAVSASLAGHPIVLPEKLPGLAEMYCLAFIDAADDRQVPWSYQCDEVVSQIAFFSMWDLCGVRQRLLDDGLIHSIEKDANQSPLMKLTSKGILRLMTYIMASDSGMVYLVEYSDYDYPFKLGVSRTADGARNIARSHYASLAHRKAWPEFLDALTHTIDAEYRQVIVVEPNVTHYTISEFEVLS